MFGYFNEFLILRSFLATTESVDLNLISQGIMSNFAVMLYFNSFISHIQYLQEFFPLLTLTSESATSSPDFLRIPV